MIEIQLIGGPAHGQLLNLDVEDVMDPPAAIELAAWVVDAVYGTCSHPDQPEITRYCRQPNPLDGGPLWLYVSETAHA